MAIRPAAPRVAGVTAAVGALGQVAFSVWRGGGLWTGGREPGTTTPVLYIPTVAGGFVLATTAAAFGHRTLGALAFGAALFAWLSLEPVLFHRLLVHDPLPAPLLPTLGIQLAPPATGGIAHLALTNGPPDLGALALLGYALLQALILVRLLPRIRAQPFTASCWAFPFGVATLASLTIGVVVRGAESLAPVALAILAVANVTVVAIAAGTVRLARNDALLPPVAVPERIGHASAPTRRATGTAA